MRIVAFPEERVPGALRDQVLELQAAAWPGDGDEPVARCTHDPALAPRSVLLLDGEHVLAALDILSKEIEHAGHRYAAAGLSTVVTRRAARGRGHGRHLVAAAHRMMRHHPYDIGLFTCDRPLKAFYETCGWHELPGTVLVGGTPEEPLPSDAPGFDKVTMADFFTPAARRARTAFEHARVDLHPGRIDRLW